MNGILAHRLAPTTSTVVVTDGDTDALVHLRENCSTNYQEGDVLVHEEPGEADTFTNLRRLAAEQLLWGKDNAMSFRDSPWSTKLQLLGMEKDSSRNEERHNNHRPRHFDVILASDIIYSPVIVHPLWETIQILLERKGGAFWMAFAKRKVPVTIEYVLETATEYGLEYQCASNNDVDEVYVYVFQWKE